MKQVRKRNILIFSFICFNASFLLSDYTKTFAQNLGEPSGSSYSDHENKQEPLPYSPLLDTNKFKISGLNFHIDEKNWEKMGPEYQGACDIPEYGIDTFESYYQQDPACHYQLDLLRLEFK